MDFELWLRLATKSRFARLDRVVAIDRHHPNRKSYTWLEASDRDHAVLRKRFGIAGKTLAPEAARRSLKVALRFAGATLVTGIERRSSPLGWRLDSRRRLMRRQIMSRRAAMPLGTASERGLSRPGLAESCPACRAPAMRPIAGTTHGVLLARCGQCDHRRKLTGGESPLAIAIDVANREPSTPADWLLKRLPPAVSGAGRLDVLDVGCWDGGLLSGLPNHWNRRGLEPNPVAAARARTAGLDVVTSSVEDWPSRPGSFDLVVMLDVLEHLEDPVTTVTKIHELLRPGAILTALTGDGGCMGARFFGDRWYYCQYPEHISFFNRGSLETLLRDCGFQTTIERVGHPMSGHLADGMKVVDRLRAVIAASHGHPAPPSAWGPTFRP